MKLRNWVAGSAMLAAMAWGVSEWQRSAGKSSRSVPVGVDSPQEATAPPEEQKPVGWVFGRMMGFPGADRPLTTTTGPGNREFAPPPSSPSAGHQP